MTEINSPFSQFSTPHTSIYKQNNTTVQNNITPKEQTAQPNKKQFDSKNFLIPTGTTAVGAIGGFAVAQFNKHKNNNIVETKIEEYRTTLLKKFNKNSDVKAINDDIQRANAVLKTIKENSISYIEKVLPDEKSPKKIASLEESLKKAKEAKEYQEATLDKLNVDLKTKFTNLVEKPLKDFIDNLMNKTVENNKAFTKKAVIIGGLIGLAISTIMLCVKNRQKEEKK